MPIVPEKSREGHQSSKSQYGEMVPTPRSHLGKPRHGSPLVCNHSTLVRKWTEGAGKYLETWKPAKLSKETLTKQSGRQGVTSEVALCLHKLTVAHAYPTPNTDRNIQSNSWRPRESEVIVG